jgi:hypothetical protein
MISITLDKGSLKRLEKKLSGIANGVPRVISMAANTAIRKGRTELVRQTSSQFTAKPGTIRAAMKGSKFASAGTGATGSLSVAQAGQIPLFDFQVKPRSITNPKLGLTKTGKKRRRGKRKPLITAAVRKGGGGTIQGAFVAEMGSGHRGVFIRKGNDKRALSELHGISVPIMASSAGVSTPVQNIMQKTFDSEVARQAARLGG